MVTKKTGKINTLSKENSISSFVDPRKDHHEFVKYAQKTIENINQ